MKLRPHHLLCVRFYCGHGYSEAFNQRMRDVIAALEAGTPFSLTQGPDDLCDACPNLKETPSGARCRTQDRVSRYDERTADALGLELTDLLIEIESIVNSGMSLVDSNGKSKIDYYINEVLEEEAVEELYDYFCNEESESIQAALDEWVADGTYTEDEVRLVRIKFLSEKAN